MEIKNWSIHVEFIVIFITLLGGYFMIEQQISTQTARIDQINCRTDQLYQMFIDLLKEKK
jgi:hypothetical protein